MNTLQKIINIIEVIISASMCILFSFLFIGALTIDGDLKDVMSSMFVVLFQIVSIIYSVLMVRKKGNYNENYVIYLVMQVISAAVFAYYFNFNFNQYNLLAIVAMVIPPLITLLLTNN